MVTFTDLQQPDHPAVIRGLTRVCGLCGAAKDAYCEPLSDMVTIPYLVHFGRAVNDTDNKRKEARNEQLA